eukprot:symbB.v1.2.024116.t1/scaffold2218.1/size85484/6
MASPEERAQMLSHRLRFIPATRGLCGETFTQQCLSARESGQRHSSGGVPLEAWTKNGVGTAGQIVFNGKGLRPDLQELHSAHECRSGLDALLSARERGTTLMMPRRAPPPQAFNVSYIPPIEQRTGRLDPTGMEAAGCRSLTRRFQKRRLENYRHEIMDSIKRNEPNAGRR